MIPLTRPYFPDRSVKKICEAISEVLNSGNLMLGKWTKNFEDSFSIKFGHKYSITTNTGTTALQISLKYFDVKGYDVLVPSGSFQTNISTIKWTGGNPVFEDMNPNT